MLSVKQEKQQTLLKGRVQCFSMQVMMNKCFILILEKKNLRRSVLSFFEKNTHFNFEKWRHRVED